MFEKVLGCESENLGADHPDLSSIYLAPMENWENPHLYGKRQLTEANTQMTQNLKQLL